MARLNTEGAARARQWVLLPAIVIAAIVLTVVSFRTGQSLDALRKQAVFDVTLGLADEKVDRVDRAIVEADDAVKELAEGQRPDDVPIFLAEGGGAAFRPVERR